MTSYAFLILFALNTLSTIFTVNFHHAAIIPSHISDGERNIISLGDFDESLDDLEMIKEHKNTNLLDQKLEHFHDFVKNFKIMKHPWEKLFVKSLEYKKSELIYQNLLEDTVKKMQDFNNVQRERKWRKVENDTILTAVESNVSYIDKRQLPDMETNDDDEDDEHDESIKGGAQSKPTPESEKFKKEYQIRINEIEEEHKAFRYSDDGKPEENVKDAFNKIIDIKTPQNCSNVHGFGIQSVECLIKEYETHELTGKAAFMKFLKIFLIWLTIYIIIAIPLWCTKGWGCCCFRFDFCRPRKILRDIQKYMSENPPGVYVNEDGEEEHYAVSSREKQLYDKINKGILHF